MIYGIDISEHNGDIDLSPFTSGFVMIRAGWGTTKDLKFDRNVAECKRLGIPFGCYWYSYATTKDSGMNEMTRFLQVVHGQGVQLGLWIDQEDADGWKSKHGFKFTHDFIAPITFSMAEILQQAGYYTGIYCSESWLKYLAPECDCFDKWAASWGTNDGTVQRNTKDVGTMLQFTSRYQGRNLDGNVCYVDLSHYSKSSTQNQDSDPEYPSIQEWYDLTIGHGYNVDGAYGNQCWDYFAYFVKKLQLGLSAHCALTGYVCDLWRLKDKYNYSKWFIYVNPSEIQKGDWVIWDKGSSCPSSHVAMVWSRSGSTGIVIGQNQGGKKYVCPVNLKLDVMGGLRFRYWAEPAPESTDNHPEGAILDLVYKTMLGEFGVGEARKTALGDRYSEVQEMINHIAYSSAAVLVQETLNGTYGNGDVRRTVLRSRYSEVQAKINAAGKSAEVYHRVKSGETLTSIAVAYKTTVENLVALNTIKNPNIIYVGQKIRVR
ncbi:MAG: GH25 family lysozyme [Erysipelotrichaceae bacterium]|nr:GH25 family lysozyme [Erysipelotrichaceae bacterium]